MKYIKKIAVYTLLSAFVITSCEDKQEVVKKNSFIDYELIGIEHNKGLDFVFKYVKQESQSKNLKTPLDFMLLVEKGT